MLSFPLLTFAAKTKNSSRPLEAGCCGSSARPNGEARVNTSRRNKRIPHDDDYLFAPEREEKQVACQLPGQADFEVKHRELHMLYVVFSVASGVIGVSLRDGGIVLRRKKWPTHFRPTTRALGNRVGVGLAAGIVSFRAPPSRRLGWAAATIIYEANAFIGGSLNRPIIEVNWSLTFKDWR